MRLDHNGVQRKSAQEEPVPRILAETPPALPNLPCSCGAGTQRSAQRHHPHPGPKARSTGCCSDCLRSEAAGTILEAKSFTLPHSSSLQLLLCGLLRFLFVFLRPALTSCH